MLDIRDLIRQLSNEEYEAFHQSLVDKKAEKSARLLNMLNDPKIKDAQIIEALNINPTSYYTLRSRLNDKIQEYLLTKVKGSKLEVLEKVNNIDHILFNYNKTQATNIIKKLEDELIRFEKPTYLISVYNALKRLHKGSSLYYNYSQQYNQHVAFLLDYDKIVELLGDFVEKLGYYQLSKLPEILEHIDLILGQIENQSAIRESHRMNIILYIVQISYQLFLREEEQSKDLEPIEDLLARAYNIIDQHPEDSLYNNLKLLIDYFSFEYYHIYKIKKKEDEYFLLINDDLPHFLNSYTYYTVPTFFLMSKLERSLRLNDLETLYEEIMHLKGDIEISVEDTVNYIQYYFYLSIACYYEGKYDDASDYLNNLRNNVVFKSFPHVEVEMKLFLALNYFLDNEHEVCNSMLKSVSRKILTYQHYDYENAKLFKKALQAALNFNKKDREDRLEKAIREFQMYNQDQYKILSFLKIDEDFISKLKG